MNELLNKIKNKYKNRIVVTNCILNAFGLHGEVFEISENSILKIKNICINRINKNFVSFYFEYNNYNVYFNFFINDSHFDIYGNSYYMKIIEN